MKKQKEMKNYKKNLVYRYTQINYGGMRLFALIRKNKSQPGPRGGSLRYQVKNPHTSAIKH